MAKRNNILALGGLVLATMMLLGMYSIRADAASTDFNVSSTAAATTTTSFLTPGTGTTTLAYDSMANGSDGAVLLTQFAASSTSSVLGISLQYSQDGIDWYDDNTLTSLNSTTTPGKSMNTANTYSWTAAGTTRALKAITLPTPTRYVRAVYTMTGANGSIWGSIVAQKQQPE